MHAIPSGLIDAPHPTPRRGVVHPTPSHLKWRVLSPSDQVMMTYVPARMDSHLINRDDAGSGRSDSTTCSMQMLVVQCSVQSSKVRSPGDGFSTSCESGDQTWYCWDYAKWHDASISSSSINQQSVAMQHQPSRRPSSWTGVWTTHYLLWELASSCGYLSRNR
jgi:hypothetical protein